MYIFMYIHTEALAYLRGYVECVRVAVGILCENHLSKPSSISGDGLIMWLRYLKKIQFHYPSF